MGKEKTKYVCDCFHITKNDMKEHIKNGIVTYKDLQKETNIGTKCSGCKKKSKAKFKKYLEKLST